MKNPIRYRLVCLLLALSLLCGCAISPAPMESTAPATVPATEPDRGQLTGNGGEKYALTQPREQQLTALADCPAGEKPYTLLVYMVGSDLESYYGCASSDLREMAASGLDPEMCNLIIYTGGSKSWELDVPSDRNCLWRLGEGGSLEAVASTSQLANMGSAATFLDFLTYAYAAFPAENYGLICWDHGGGPLYGYGNDELFGYDCLTLSELSQALSQSPFAGEKLAFMGFDACLMGSLEVADLFSDYARYLIASQETEPGSGWDYSFLSVLNETADPLTLAGRVLDAYEQSMKHNPWKPEYTLSLIDLGAVANLQTRLESLWSELEAALGRGGFGLIAQTRSSCKRFGLGSVSDLTTSLDLVDLGDLLSRLDSPGAAAAREGLEGAVLRQVTNLEGACGLSLYFPYDNKTLYETGGSTVLDVRPDAPRLNAFLRSFTDLWLYGALSVDLSPEQTLQENAHSLTMSLTAHQLENLGAATYTVFQYDPEDNTYLPLLADMPLEADENGTLTIPRNPTLLRLSSDLDDPLLHSGDIWPVRQVSRSSGKETYATIESVLMTSGELLVGSHQWIQMTLSLADTGAVEIQSIQSNDDDAVFFGKQDVDISHFGCIAYHWNPLHTTFDGAGDLLPWKEWETNGVDVFTYKDYTAGFSLSSAPLQTYTGIYYVQVVLTDLAGNVIGTRLAELYRNVPYETVIQELPLGTMTSRVYPDHAEITRFTVNPDAPGNGDRYGYKELDLVLPEQVNGVPITIIGPEAFLACIDLRSVVIPDTVTDIQGRAFAGCWELKAVRLPKNLRRIGDDAFDWNDIVQLDLPYGLERIGARAFSGLDARTVTIPDTVRYIGPGAFYGGDTLTAIYASSDYYQSVDGVLYTADGKTLVCFPGGKATEFDIPQGVETIFDMAFRRNTRLTRISFPESLKVIRQLAFCDVENLTRLDLPENLEVIGNGAFCTELTLYPKAQLDTIHIGPRVQWIGQEAFSALPMLAFSVDPENEHYSSANGCLLNKSGSRLIQAPYRHTGLLEVPHGVSVLEKSSLQGCDAVTELVLPDSLVSIVWGAWVPRNLEKLTVGAGLADWQNIHNFAEVPEIVISPQNAHYTMVGTSIYSTDGKILYLLHSQQSLVALPEGLEEITYGALGGCQNVTVLQIPASVNRISAYNFQLMTGLKAIQVAPGNSYVASHDGLMYSADWETLLVAPLGKTGLVQVREGTVEIGTNAFYNGYDLQATTVIIPEGVTQLRYGNFQSVAYGKVLDLYLPASLKDIHPNMLKYMDSDRIRVHAPAGSYAEQFALERGFTVIN